MKQDVLVYLLVPPFAFITTTIFIAFLPLLKFIDISAQLSQMNGNPPVIDYVILMLIIYYTTVAIMIRDSQKLCQHKLKKMIITNWNNKSKYGQDTEKQINKLKQNQIYIDYIQKGIQSSAQKNKLSQNISQNQKQKRKIKLLNILDDQSDQDSQHQNLLLSCHHVATSKKMF